MKRLTLVLAVCLCQAGWLRAQDELYKYDRIPDRFQQVFNDVCRECLTQVVNTAHGQYWGHARDGALYGYGIFINNNGSQWIGQYREGECIFGILMDDQTANVGSRDFYALYDLRTGQLVRIQTPNGPLQPDAAQTKAYRFESLTYANGDRYVGETYNGLRHGYGIYYWNDGQFWYGQYRNNVRNGYGVLFGKDHKLFTGRWLNNESLR